MTMNIEQTLKDNVKVFSSKHTIDDFSRRRERPAYQSEDEFQRKSEAFQERHRAEIEKDKELAQKIVRAMALCFEDKSNGNKRKVLNKKLETCSARVLSLAISTLENMEKKSAVKNPKDREEGAKMLRKRRDELLTPQKEEKKDTILDKAVGKAVSFVALLGAVAERVGNG